MVTSKIKGIYKGFKHITQIFVVKDRELEIGCPTDVKHVAHIGWDGTTGNSPSWLSLAKPCGGCANNTTGIPRDSNSTMFFTPWSSQGIN
ncbi:CRIB domain-containing protein RIC10 [Linum perenne]